MTDYNRFANEFASTRVYLWDDILPLLNYIKKNDRVLDIGCGNGRLYQILKENQVDYTGLDISEELIYIAKNKYPEADFIVGDMKKLFFADFTFDVIFSIASFHHLLDKKTRIESLKEMKRVLKKDGRILMTNLNILGGWAREKIKKGDFVSLGDNNFSVPWRNSKREILGERIYHAFDLSELEELFNEVGLVVEENYYIKKGEKSDQENAENIISILAI